MARTGYVIRSMSTTNWDVRNPSQKVTPYHVYLYPPEKRGNAWWTPYLGDAAVYATPQEAHAEARRANQERAQVAPVDASEFPTYWEIEDMNTVYRLAKGKGWSFR